jgi:hypothetical protein
VISGGYQAKYQVEIIKEYYEKITSSEKMDGCSQASIIDSVNNGNRHDEIYK